VKAVPKPIPFVVALAGLGAFSWGLYHLLLIGSCGGAYAPCPAGSGRYFIGVAAGLPVAIFATIAGGGTLTFIGTFLAVGVTSIVAGLSDQGADMRGFLFPFGGIFVAVALAPLLVAPWVLARRRKASRLVEHGTQAIGTVTNNPRVKLLFRIEPQDGTPAFEAAKTVTVSRVEIPRAGDRYPVWFDPEDHDTFAFGTAMTSDAAPGVRRLFALAGQAAGPTLPPPETPAPPADPDPFAKLARLNELRLAGALTDEEFAVQKQLLLTRISAG
jgi:hypothetical protein